MTKKLSQKGPVKADILHTQLGDFNLDKQADVKKLQRVVITLQKQTDALTKKDIASWRTARQLAINVEQPNRQQLYSIYSDVEMDGHLSGSIGQLNGFVKARSFKLVDKKSGVENEDGTELLNKTWFKDLIDLILSSRYWGHSLIQLGDVVQDEDGLSYNGVTLLPRKHVVPEYGRITELPGDDWQRGIDYRQAPYSDWLIEAGKPTDLGLYLKAALQTIPKKNMLAFWDTFGEVFGMPIRVAKTSTRQPEERRKLEDAMDKLGACAWGVIGEGTDIEIKESSKGDAYNVYDKRVDRADNELSKLIIYQTMTIEDGSSLSQSKTHLTVFENLVEEVADSVRDIINGQLLPRMAQHGFPVAGLRFDWNYEQDYTPEQMKGVEEMLLYNYDIPGEYFEKKYGIKVGERRQDTQTLQGRTHDHGFFD